MPNWNFARGFLHKVLFLLAPIISYTCPLDAQDDVDTSMAAIYAMSLEELLDTKVTIATKSDQKISETPAIVSVITAEDIQNIGLRELEEIINLVPGMEFFKVKEGSNTISIRGITNVNQGARVLIMIDGTIYNGVMYGSALFSGVNLNIDAIDRVEIIRGPGSTLYGRNAFSTVINIITKSGLTNEGVHISSSYGSYNTYDFIISYGINKEKYNGYISLRKYYSDYTDATFRNGMGSESIVDNHHNNYFCDVNFSIGKLRFTACYTNIESGVSAGYFNTNGKNLENIGIYSLEYTSKISERLQIRAKLFGRNENRIQDIEFFKPTFTDTLPSGYPAIPVNTLYPEGMYALPEFNSYIYGGELEFRYDLLMNNQLLFGLQADTRGIKDATIQANYSFSTYMPLQIIEDGTIVGYYSKQDMPLFKGNEGWIKDGGHSYSNLGLFLQDIFYPFDNLGITMGVRYDLDSEVDPVFNPRLGIVYEFYENAHLKMLYSQAYRIPTCSEQFKLTGFDIGNEDLEPEKIKSTEIALSYKLLNTRTQISFFNNKANNLIVRNPTNRIYYNLGENIAKGLEFESHVYFSKFFTTFLNYSFVNSENKELINDTLTLIFEAPNISNHRLNTGFNYKLLHYFNINTYVSYIGPITKFSTLEGSPISQQKVGDVILINATLGIELNENIKFVLSGYNIFNQEYYYQSDQLSMQPRQNGRHFLARVFLHF